jgi:hypothetical protein
MRLRAMLGPALHRRSEVTGRAEVTGRSVAVVGPGAACDGPTRAVDVCDEAAVAAAAPIDAAGKAKTPSGPVKAGRATLHTDVLNTRARADPTGYEVHVNLLDLRSVSATEFTRRRRLVR